MRLPPRVEPRWIVLRAHERTLWLMLADDFKALLGLPTEVGRLEELRDESVFDDARRIAGVERNLKTGVDRGQPQSADVVYIPSVKPVFVLDLHHQYRTSTRDLEWRKPATDFRYPPLRRIKPSRIRRPHGNRLRAVRCVIRHQPPRCAAALPLRACIRPGTQDHPQPFILRHAAECRRIRRSFPIELARFAFVIVPEHVASDGVHAHRAEHS